MTPNSFPTIHYFQSDFVNGPQALMKCVGMNSKYASVYSRHFPKSLPANSKTANNVFVQQIKSMQTHIQKGRICML